MRNIQLPGELAQMIRDDAKVIGWTPDRLFNECLRQGLKKFAPANAAGDASAIIHKRGDVTVIVEGKEAASLRSGATRLGFSIDEYIQRWTITVDCRLQ